VKIDAALVTRLIARQFPRWADLPVRPVDAGGWDNRTFRLGDDMSVRLPSAAAYAAQVDKEQVWLPRLAPQLPLPIPRPLARGTPDLDYPWQWSVYEWIDGECATLEGIADLGAFAIDLGSFIAALQRSDTAGAPAPGTHNFWRGGPLSVYDTETRQAIAALAGRIDVVTATRTWGAALAAAWRGPPVWVHGDVAAGNLLVRDGGLAAVIDFGCAAVGDPACDTVIAWTFLSGASRRAFRSTLGIDDATWARGRGWALWKALITLERYADDAVVEARAARRTLDAVLTDFVEG
jgi:aminoglycoside phosphotransferase (APT) family kinase protein